MPVITGLSTSTTRLANSAFALTFFPRVMESMWARLCGTTRSSSEVEPFAFIGASPLLRLFNGQMNSQPVPSYTINVPNPVWKNIEIFKRSQFEFDQTGTLGARVGALGVKVAQHWDYLLAGMILKASTAGSQNFTFYEDGKTYTMTFDGLPLFSVSHNTGNLSAPVQSNIIQGNLPTTVASLNAQDIALSANQMQRDISALIQRISTVVDDKGALIYPDFQPAKQLLLLVPPALWAAAEMAFRIQNGTLGGSNGTGGTAGASTNIGYRMVKEVIQWNLLTAVPDVTNPNPGVTVTPVNATEYYAFIEGDYIKPWYFQRFVPIQRGQVIPLGEDPMGQADQIIRAASASGLNVRPEAAEIYAATEIDHNLGALGSNAQESVVAREEFFVSARTRGQIFPGPWFSAWKIDPSSLSS